MRIDEETLASGWRHDQVFAELLAFPKVLHEVPAAGVQKHLLVIAESVEEIQDGEAASFVRVVAGRQENAVRNRAAQYPAGRRAAFAPSCATRG